MKKKKILILVVYGLSIISVPFRVTISERPFEPKLFLCQLLLANLWCSWSPADLYKKSNVLVVRKYPISRAVSAYLVTLMSYYMAFQPSVSEFFIMWLSATSFIPIIVRIIALITKAMTVICSVFVFALWSFGSGASLVVARWAFTKCVMLLVYVRAICYLFFLIYTLWFSVRTRILSLLICHLVL